MGERTLTEADIEAITEAFKQHQRCALGLTPEEAQVIKSHLNWWKKGVSLTGTIIMTTIIVGILGLISKSFWMSVIDTVKGK
jgi:hypothetical protein